MLTSDNSSRHPLSDLPITSRAVRSTAPSDVQNLKPAGSNSSLRGLKSNSTSSLPTVAGSSSSPSSAQLIHDRSRSETTEFNTLSRTPTPNGTTPNATSPSSGHHPDLTNEIATLSTKLVNAINHQTNLDDTLQRTRHLLEDANKRIAELEEDASKHDELISTGALVKREEIDISENSLRTELNEERLKRANAEKERRKIELELEKLTGELFEEANSMVADARKQSLHSEQQKEQLKAQLQDAEVLLASHQEQLRELKDVLQQMQTERAEENALQQQTSMQQQTTPQQQQSVPTTPTTSAQKKKNSGIFGPLHLHQDGSTPQTVYPDHPLSFSSLILPVLRSDIHAFDEFSQLLKSGGKASPSSRANSGNFGGLNVMGLGSLSNQTQSKIDKSSQSQPNTLNNNSSLTSSSSSPTPQSIPGAFNASSPSESSHQTSTASALKDAKYYKRALNEDIEPTLRLDTAPGLSWLTRRSIVSSMASGNLVVEPFPYTPRYASSFHCSLCGEGRDGETYIRRHRFRVNDSDDAQRYPVCDYCVGRLRATGDFVNFLRMVRLGHWRSESIEDARLAWEECVRLRERMFWSRIGGGVVPSAYDATGTPRRSRHFHDRSVSEAYLDDIPQEAAEEGLQDESTPAEGAPTAEDKSPQVEATETDTSDAPPPQPPRPQSAQPEDTQPPELTPVTSADFTVAAAVSAAKSEENRPKSRGKSVEALRSRFESATASASSSTEDLRVRRGSRTPSPQKQA